MNAVTWLVRDDLFQIRWITPLHVANHEMIMYVGEGCLYGTSANTQIGISFFLWYRTR